MTNHVDLDTIMLKKGAHESIEEAAIDLRAAPLPAFRSIVAARNAGGRATCTLCHRRRLCSITPVISQASRFYLVLCRRCAHLLRWVDVFRKAVVVTDAP